MNGVVVAVGRRSVVDIATVRDAVLVAIRSGLTFVWNLVLVTVLGSSTRQVAFIRNAVLVTVRVQLAIVGDLIAVAIVPDQFAPIGDPILIAIV